MHTLEILKKEHCKNINGASFMKQDIFTFSYVSVYCLIFL